MNTLDKVETKVYTKWEYKEVNTEHLISIYELNRYGKDGWELIFYKNMLVGYNYYFKRIKDEKSNYY